MVVTADGARFGAGAWRVGGSATGATGAALDEARARVEAATEAVTAATAARDAARGVGMTGAQVLRQVEIPAALPLLLSGLRSAMLQIIATATLAAYVGAGGLGRQLFLGLQTYDYAVMLGASLVVILLAILVDTTFGITQRLLRRVPGLAGTG